MTWWRALLWWRPPCLLRQVIVNLDGGDAIRGVLFGSRGAWLTLKEADGLTEGQPAARIDGDVVIHRSKVQFIQVLP